MTKSYIEVSVQGDSSLYEPAIGIMSGMGFEGFWEDEVVLRCYVETGNWSPALQEAFSARLSLLSDSLKVPPPLILTQSVEQKNWNEEWERSIKPVAVTERITITPSWHPVKEEARKIVLVIDPKMSFGTGYHETTRLVLKLLERHLAPGMRLLDVGTGTGILAIAGVRLGAAEALGIDNDDWSFENARENVELNHVQEQISINLAELEDVQSEPFDMIVANIQRNILLELLPLMKERLVPNGILILSGLLESDEEEMINAIHDHGFRMIEQLQGNEWIALVARHPETAITQ